MTSFAENRNTEKYLNKPILLFFLFWMVTFVLYLPAAKAGMDGDFPYWALTIKHDTFAQFINTSDSALPILYQFSQLIKYIFYNLFGLNPWLWHLLHVTLQAVVALLFFKVLRKILDDSKVGYAPLISLTSVLLFCITPHANEVIVREMCYHYIQGFIFILLIMLSLLHYLDTQQGKYAWIAGGIFLVSTFSLEVFYLTPWLLLTITLYYRLVLGYDKKLCTRAAIRFFVPQLVIFIAHLLLLRLLWGNRMAHIGTLSFSNPVGLFNKPILYLYHIFLLGRYWPQDIKVKVYAFFDSAAPVITFYALVGLLSLLFIIFFRRIHIKVKAMFMFAMFAMVFLMLAMPLDFPPVLRVIGDRYLYIPSAFTAVIFVLAISFIPNRITAIAFFCLYFLCNIYYALKTNKAHYYAAAITEHLLTSLPDPGNKKILLLNLPNSMFGALMIRAQEESEFKTMNNLFYPDKKITNEVYDVCSYNMIGRDDGGHATVINDSMMHVTLNQWGTWWWFGDGGAGSYENKEFRVNMIDVGHWYELTLKHPASEYLILYQVGRNWKVVDWSKKNVDQN